MGRSRIRESFRFENGKHAQGSKYTSFQLLRIKRLSFPSEAKGWSLVRNSSDWSSLLSIDTLLYKSMFLCFLFYQPRYHFFFTGQRNQSKHKQTTARASIWFADNCTRRFCLCYVTIEKHSVWKQIFSWADGFQKLSQFLLQTIVKLKWELLGALTNRKRKWRQRPKGIK